MVERAETECRVAKGKGWEVGCMEAYGRPQRTGVPSGLGMGWYLHLGMGEGERKPRRGRNDRHVRELQNLGVWSGEPRGGVH